MKVDTGISESDRKTIADGLSRVLADSYTLYLKTHNYHWNVTGPMFAALHNLFEEQYLELAEAVDVIAERIRAVGHPAPGSYKAFSKLTVIEEEDDSPGAGEMARRLAAAQEALVHTAREVHDTISKTNDEVSVDLLIQRMTVHEKNAWMLRSMIEE